MIAKRSAWAALMLTASAGAAFAQTTTATEKVTVSSLLAKDYAVAGAISTASGAPGLFLRKGPSLYVCFIAETKQSATVATQYCKPVE